MLRFVTTIMLSALAAIPATAAPIQPLLMTRDGEHYRYTTELKGDLVAIRGEQLESGEKIDLVLDARGWVDGTVGGSVVRFNVPKAKRDAIVASLAKPLVAAAPTVAQLATIK